MACGQEHTAHLGPCVDPTCPAANDTGSSQLRTTARMVGAGPALTAGPGVTCGCCVRWTLEVWMAANRDQARGMSKRVNE